MSIHTSPLRSCIFSLGVLVILGGCSPRLLRSEPVEVPRVTVASVELDVAGEMDPAEPASVAPVAHEAPLSPELAQLAQVVEDGSEPPVDAREVLGDARLHAITSVQRYLNGDLPGAHDELDVALKTMLAADLPQGRAGLRQLQSELPAVYAEQDLVAIYEAAQGASTSTEAEVALDEIVEQGPGVGGPQGVGDASVGDGGEEPADDEATLEALEDAAEALDDPTYIRAEIDRIARAFGETEVGEHETFLREVERFIRYYQVDKRGFFERSLARSLKHMAMVEEVLAEKGVPREMAYIAFVESGFRPRATSPAGARGLWQFMPRTARAYGLQVDRATDQRLDPMQATIAAREYFLDLVAIFGSRSFLLAMASYNAGEGRVQGCLKRLDDPFTQRTFWHIAPCLRKETQEYIPRIIAAAVIASDPERFGFTPWGTVGTPDYDIITVAEPTSVNLLASWAGISLNELRAMNPDLMAADSTTPKQAEAYPLIVPSGKGQVVERELVALGIKSSIISGVGVAEAKTEGDVKVDVVEPPAEVAAAVTVEVPAAKVEAATEPASASATTSPNKGKAPVVVAPAPKAAPRAKAAPAPVKSPVVAAVVPRPPQASRAPVGDDGEPRTKFIRYRAQPGNSLAQISEDFEKPTEKILGWNPYLRDRDVQAGDVVFIYELDWSYQRHLHPVMSGETLSGLSQRYRVPMGMISRWNGLEDGGLIAGDTLVIYTRDGLTASADTRTSPAKGVVSEARRHELVYGVQVGNSLSRLSGYFGVGIDDIKAWNELSTDEVEVGSKLTLYTAEPVKVVNHVVRSGETLADLSRTYNVKLSFLADTNGLSRDAHLRVGQGVVVYIP